MSEYELCGKPIHRSEEGALIYDAPYDPWAPPIHAPRADIPARLTWINIDLPDEPRWGDRWTEQENAANQPLFQIRAKHRSALALWVVTRADGSVVGEGDTLAFCKSLAQDDWDNRKDRQ